MDETRTQANGADATARPLVLRRRAFGLVWVTEAAGAVGSGLSGVALPWLVLTVTGSPLGLGLAFALRSAPDVVVAPAIGHLLDTRARRPVLFAAEVLTGALVAALGLAAAAGALTTPWLFGAMLALSVLGNAAHNARRAALPAVAGEELDAANAWFDGTRSALSVAFLLTGGALTATVGAPRTLVAAGAAPALGALALLALRRPLREGDADGGGDGLLDGAWTGLRAVVGTPRIRFLLGVGVAINLLVVPVPSVVLPTLGRETFASPLALTLLLGGFRGGAVAGNWAVGRVEASRRATLAAGILAVGATTVLAGAAGVALPHGTGVGPTLLVVVALLTLAGAGQPLYNVPMSSMLQTAAPEERRGRVVTLTNSLLQASFPVPLLVAGALLTQVPAFVLLAAEGAGLVALGAGVRWLGGDDR